MDPINNRHSLAPCICGIVSLLLLLGAVVPQSRGASDPYAAWDGTLTPAAKLPFAPIVPFEAEYQFGWVGVSAGAANVHISTHDGGRRAISVRGGPNDWIRTLWNYEALYTGEVGDNGEVPSWLRLDEHYPKGDLRSEASFKEGSVIACHRKVSEVKPWEHTDLPGVRDLFAAILFVRSQPLRNGDKMRVTVFPDESPYLADITVVARDTITIMEKKVHAIRFTLHIQSIETRGEHKGRLTPYKKFRSGRIWLSDDAERIPLRAEVDIFVGRVFAELVSLKTE